MTEEREPTTQGANDADDGELTQPLQLSSAGSRTPAAGWYPDPENQSQWRYWDGSTWTRHRAPLVPPTPAGSAVAPYRPPQPVTRPVQHVGGPQQPTPPRTMVTSDAHASGAHVAIAWICCVVTLGYLLPWAIAATRGKRNAGAIGVLNFLLGWTFIGWVAALVMACSSHQSIAVAR